MRRREFGTLLGGAAASSSLWPLAAPAQQRALPVIGFLSHGSAVVRAPLVAGFRQGLNEAGFVEGRNVAFEYRWAEDQFDRLPGLATDLVRRPVAVIFANGPPSVRAAKAATATIPIVFSMGEDPITEGVVSGFTRPEGNVTGFSFFTNQLFGKRLGLLHDIVPKAAMFALLVNPNNPNAEPDAKDAQVAADALGRQLFVLKAWTERDFEPAFAAMVERKVGGLVVGVDASLFSERRAQLIALAARHAIPAMYHDCQYPDSGGLMSYGASQVDSWRQAGGYVGRILKGDKPADLPVQQSTRFEFVINLKTAKALGLDIPPGILAIVDEEVE
jgi:putative ABC transport system substrate-binding protein